jgi:hypothetical protein
MGHAGGPGISVAILSWPSAAVALETQHMPVTITTVGTISKDEVLLKGYSKSTSSVPARH